MHGYMGFFLSKFFLFVVAVVVVVADDDLLFQHKKLVRIWFLIQNLFNSLHVGCFLCFCRRLLIFFFQNCLFQGCQMVQVQTVCNYQQTTKVTASTEIKYKICRS